MLRGILRKKVKDILDFTLDKSHRKAVAGILAASALIGAAFIAKDIAGAGTFVTGAGGSVVELVPRSGGRNTFNVRIRASKNGKSYERNAVIILQDASGDDSARKKEADELSEMERAVDEALSDVERAGERRVRLPSKGIGGVKLTWEKEKPHGAVAVILVPLLLFAGYYESEKQKKDKVRKSETESVNRMLPSFNDQLLLLLSSGMVLSDAFNSLADSYKVKEKKEYFDEEIINIADRARADHRSIANVMNEEAQKLQIREFSRLSGVISDGQYRGIDICSKLESESSLLWQLRKNSAEAIGKLAETKMTIPLALLLFVLVVVTTAPALIQVEGG